MSKEELKEQCINMYLDGKTYVEIAKLTGWSRTYITNLIKADERIKELRNTKKIKVHKRKDNRQMVIYIPTEFIEKLGVSRDFNKEDFVNVRIDEKNKNIIIEKHS